MARLSRGKLKAKTQKRRLAAIAVFSPEQIDIAASILVSPVGEAISLVQNQDGFAGEIHVAAIVLGAIQDGDLPALVALMDLITGEAA